MRDPLASVERQHELLLQLPLAQEFEHALGTAGLWPYQPQGIEVMQLNVGKQCNQTCRHCHVDAGPDRTETMTQETMALCLDALSQSQISTVDITGGAPELNPHFRWLVQSCRKLGRHVIDRCNLTILLTRAHRNLPDFFADQEVEVVCSLPHWRANSTDRQRGEGVFEKSIAGIRMLNAVGYGQGDPRRRLVVVTNPAGAFLPAPQRALEHQWKRELALHHGITFDSLFTITNMPISRYLQWLRDSDNLHDYMTSLVSAFNPIAAASTMCRSMISVGWDGNLYDCDFNQMLDIRLNAEAPQHIRDFAMEPIRKRSIATGRHCFGCTAGAGSSCGGSTAT